MKIRIAFWLTIVCFLLAFNLIQAQFNVQVGYGISLVDPKVNEALMNNYLIENEWLNKENTSIKTLHGIDLGWKYSWTGLALGMVWNNRGGKLSFEGVTPSTGNQNKQEFFYNLNTYSLFLETNTSIIGLGAAIDWNDFGIKRRYTELDQKLDIAKESEWGNHFYLNLNFPAGNSNRVTLKFSYRFLMDGFDVNPLANSILNANQTNYSKEKWNHFGISLLISNGPQN